MLDCGSDPVCPDQSDSEHRMVTVWSRAELVHANYPGQAQPAQVSGDLWLSASRSSSHSGDLISLPHCTDITTPHSTLQRAFELSTRKQSQVSNGFAGIKQDNALVRRS